MRLITKKNIGPCQFDNHLVTAENKRGLLYLEQQADGLLHLIWKNRVSSQIEEDFIIFPDEAEFKKVAQCTDGRVYVLKFKNSSQRVFFWVQEVSADKDVELIDTFNKLMKGAEE